MNLMNIRSKSLVAAEQLGCSINPDLPLPEYKITRSLGEIAERIFCLDVVLAVSYGFDRKLASKWIESENLANSFTKKELVLLNGEAKDFLIDFQIQADSLFCLLWAAGLIEKMQLSEQLRSDLVSFVPDLRILESSKPYLLKMKKRSENEIFEKTDLAYNLHWAITHARLNGKPIPKPLNQITVIERRRALEWICSDCNWDEVPLDT